MQAKQQQNELRSSKKDGVSPDLRASKTYNTVIGRSISCVPSVGPVSGPQFSIIVPSVTPRDKSRPFATEARARQRLRRHLSQYNDNGNSCAPEMSEFKQGCAKGFMPFTDPNNFQQQVGLELRVDDSAILNLFSPLKQKKKDSDIMCSNTPKSLCKYTKTHAQKYAESKDVNRKPRTHGTVLKLSQKKSSLLAKGQGNQVPRKPKENSIQRTILPKIENIHNGLSIHSSVKASKEFKNRSEQVFPSIDMALSEDTREILTRLSETYDLRSSTSLSNLAKTKDYNADFIGSNNKNQAPNTNLQTITPARLALLRVLCGIDEVANDLSLGNLLNDQTTSMHRRKQRLAFSGSLPERAQECRKLAARIVQCETLESIPTVLQKSFNASIPRTLSPETQIAKHASSGELGSAFFTEEELADFEGPFEKDSNINVGHTFLTNDASLIEPFSVSVGEVDAVTQNENTLLAAFKQSGISYDWPTEAALFNAVSMHLSKQNNIEQLFESKMTFSGSNDEFLQVPGWCPLPDSASYSKTIQILETVLQNAKVSDNLKNDRNPFFSAARMYAVALKYDFDKVSKGVRQKCVQAYLSDLGVGSSNSSIYSNPIRQMAAAGVLSLCADNDFNTVAAVVRAAAQRIKSEAATTISKTIPKVFKSNSSLESGTFTANVEAQLYNFAKSLLYHFCDHEIGSRFVLSEIPGLLSFCISAVRMEALFLLRRIGLWWKAKCGNEKWSLVVGVESDMTSDCYEPEIPGTQGYKQFPSFETKSCFAVKTEPNEKNWSSTDSDNNTFDYSGLIQAILRQAARRRYQDTEASIRNTCNSCLMDLGASAVLNAQVAEMLTDSNVSVVLSGLNDLAQRRTVPVCAWHALLQCFDSYCALVRTAACRVARRSQLARFSLLAALTRCARADIESRTRAAAFHAVAEIITSRPHSYANGCYAVNITFEFLQILKYDICPRVLVKGASALATLANYLFPLYTSSASSSGNNNNSNVMKSSNSIDISVSRVGSSSEKTNVAEADSDRPVAPPSGSSTVSSASSNNAPSSSVNLSVSVPDALFQIRELLQNWAHGKNVPAVVASAASTALSKLPHGLARAIAEMINTSGLSELHSAQNLNDACGRSRDSSGASTRSIASNPREAEESVLAQHQETQVMSRVRELSRRAQVLASLMNTSNEWEEDETNGVATDSCSMKAQKSAIDDKEYSELCARVLGADIKKSKLSFLDETSKKTETSAPESSKE